MTWNSNIFPVNDTFFYTYIQNSPSKKNSSAHIPPPHKKITRVFQEWQEQEVETLH